jgi:ribosome biogenesis GTPase
MHPSFTKLDDSSLIQLENLKDCGVVYKKTIGNYLVHTNGRVIPCAISSRLRKQLIYPTADPNSLRHVVRGVKEIEHVDPVAIGDVVRYVDAQNGSGMIVEILPRRNRLARRAAVPMPGAHPFEQVIVANVDQVVPVFAAANPAPKWNLLDRYLASAESLDLPALICITKLDLVQEGQDQAMQELQEMMDEYRQIGYQVVLTSAMTYEGLEELRQALSGRISVLLGKSGVGKTALLNALQPGLGLRVNEVSRVTGKGKHTTTHLEMFPLNWDGTEETGAIVDTPGVREFGLWDVNEDDLALFFPEMRPFVGKCKFGLDCQHDDEPGCAIRKAVMAGKISPRRYQSYMVLKQDVSFT